MSLIKFEKTSEYLIINIRYNNILNSIKLKGLIFNLLSSYCDMIRWNLYQILDPKNNSIYYYISNETFINIERIYYIFNNFLKNNSNILVSYGCYNKKEFNKNLNKYKNTHVISYYKKKINWNIICIHENNICNNYKNCNLYNSQ